MGGPSAISRDRSIEGALAGVTLSLILISLSLASPVHAQSLDLLIKGGHVIDSKNGISGVMDVGIADGRIAEVARNIAEDRAATVVDASGLYVTPGLIDPHAHVFSGTESDGGLSNGRESLPPDGFVFRSGVTTVVDVGGSGWRNFAQFKAQTIDYAKTRVLAFLNIVGSGMKGGHIEQNNNDMDPKMTALVAKQYPGLIVGVKLAHYEGREWEPTDRAVEAGRLADLPVMIDFGRAEPVLPLDELLFQHLRPGDIFTHTYGNVGRRMAIVDEAGHVRPFLFEAQERGIIFDVGHGGGSFAFSQAVPATEQGFWPNSISTDLHTGSMNGGMKTLANVMSKFLNLGMSIEDVIRSTTWTPAQYLHRPDLGNLDVGVVADVAVFNLRTGDFGFLDARDLRMPGTQKLEAELTIREGEVVWDLNGISRPLWN